MTNPTQEARAREVLEHFVSALTNEGRNPENMLSFDHDRLRLCVAEAKEAVAISPPRAVPSGEGSVEARRLGWDQDGMCDDHYRFACPDCALPDQSALAFSQVPADREAKADRRLAAKIASLKALSAKATDGAWLHYDRVFRRQFGKGRVTEIQRFGDGKAIVCWGGFDGLPDVTARKRNHNARFIVELVNFFRKNADAIEAALIPKSAGDDGDMVLKQWIAGVQGIADISQQQHSDLRTACTALDAIASKTAALLAAARPSTPNTDKLPDDVVRLVIAARVVAWEDPDPDALRELQQASEAFASRVPWEDAPEDAA